MVYVEIGIRGIGWAMLRAFVDDSGSGGDSKWVVMAGYVASLETWRPFTDSWCGILQAHPTVPVFHASEAESLRPDGPWAEVTRIERDLKIDQLISLIQESRLQPVCVRLRQSDFNAVMHGKIPPIWDNAYYPLFTAFVGCCTMILARHSSEPEKIEFIFDNHERYRIDGPKFYESLCSVPYIGDNSAPKVQYKNDEDFPPLQAADLLAWQVRRAFSVTRETRRAHYGRLRDDSGGPPFLEVIMTAKDLQNWMDKFDAFAEQILVDLGLPPGVRPWKSK